MYRKIIVIFFFFNLFSTYASSHQSVKCNAEIDTLLLHKLINLKEKAEAHIHNKPLDAYFYYKKAYLLLTPELKQTLLGIDITKEYGNYFTKSENYDYALFFLFEVENGLKNMHPPVYMREFTVFNEIAGIYNKINDTVKSVKYYKKAMNVSKKLSDKLWVSSANNNLGYFYYQREQYKKALSYFIKAQQLLDLQKKAHVVFNTDIEENIAHVYFNKNQFKTALSKYKEVSDTRYYYKDSMSAIRVDLSIANVYYHLDSLSKSLQLGKRIEAFYDKHYTSKEKYESGDYFKLFQLKILLSAKQNREKPEMQYVKDYVFFLRAQQTYKEQKLKQSIKGYIEQLKLQFDKKIFLEKKISGNLKLLKKKQEIIFLILSLFLILVVVSLLMMVKIRKSRNIRLEQENRITQLELENVTLEKERTKQELESKQKDIVNVVSYSTMRVEFLKSLLQKVEKKAIDNTLKRLIKPIVIDLKNQISVEERLTALQGDLSKSNAYFKEKLKKEYPDLTKTEREICALIKLNLSIKEIAQVRNSSIDSVKMVRSRIRKKMHLTSKDELEKTIQSI